MSNDPRDDPWEMLHLQSERNLSATGGASTGCSGCLGWIGGAFVFVALLVQFIR